MAEEQTDKLLLRGVSTRLTSLHTDGQMIDATDVMSEVWCYWWS